MTTDPDYEFPPRKTTPKAGWTIWSIKNRWLRVAVAWPFVITSFVVVAVLGAGSAAVGAFYGAKDRLSDDFIKGEWGLIAVAAWAAMTGKDEPQ